MLRRSVALAVLLAAEALVAPPALRKKTRRVDKAGPPALVPFPSAGPGLVVGAKKKGDLEGDAAVGSSGFRQLVGFRGAADTEDEPLWKIRVQLTKPGTWVPLIWGVACGAAASGNYRWPLVGGATLAEGGEDLAKALTCMVLSGPFLTGFCQTINDWYDKDLDAINEPYRPGQEMGDSTSLQRGCSRSNFQGESIHALSSSREMIARPKMSQIECKTIEI